MLSQNTVLCFGVTFVVCFESYCVLTFSYLRNGHAKCHDILSHSSWDRYKVHDIIISISTKIQVTVFWIVTATYFGP